uniref:NADH-ubiquinone oxidoreductase chain 5 n=1 Tax=Tenomerga trabecula TaxID=2843307 RepID=A0A8F0F679_9COLE|nr:NADH dehydrogenase subunit 5 [Tenomerga trabecula]
MVSELSLCKLYFLFLLFFSLCFFFFACYFVIMNSMMMIEWELISFNSSLIVMVILLDWLSLFFGSFVLFISCMVILYSFDYMSSDLMINRFIYLVLMFVLSMLLMIFSPNLISIILGWDGLGLVSFCLVIYYQNISSYNAGFLTILSNRIGDVMILISITWMINYGSFNFFLFLNCLTKDFEMMLIGILISIACFTKSAQIPFSAWLPAAMAAPTPVSSLVHSSTLVTAGIYLMIRFNFLLNETLSFLILFISSMTMFMAGLGANFEFDLSKIIALSTLSQLGLMMMILSMGNYLLSFFHLLMHALFKALLFMCAGFIIHNFGGNQDIRNLGGIVKIFPFISICLLISSLSLCGMPFLAGFYSKDLIIEIVLMSKFNIYIFFVLMVSTGLTVSYTFRLFYYVFLGNFNYKSLISLDYKNLCMVYSMIPMVIMVIFGGSFISWMVFPFPDLIFLPLLFKLLALLLSFLGVWMGLEISFLSFGEVKFLLMFNKMNMFFSLMWFFPGLSTSLISFFPLKGGLLMSDLIDYGWNETLGLRGLMLNMEYFSKVIQKFYLNNLQVYMMLFLFLNLFFYLYWFI